MFGFTLVLKNFSFCFASLRLGSLWFILRFAKISGWVFLYLPIIQQKVCSLVHSEVHTMLDALLPPDTYFRFNPYLSEDIPLNESRLEKLNFLKSEGEHYLKRNEAKLKKAASVLGQEKSSIQRLAEWVKLKTDMYEGLPFMSKL